MLSERRDGFKPSNKGGVRWASKGDIAPHSEIEFKPRNFEELKLRSLVRVLPHKWQFFQPAQSQKHNCHAPPPGSSIPGTFHDVPTHSSHGSFQRKILLHTCRLQTAVPNSFPLHLPVRPGSPCSTAGMQDRATNL